MSKLVLVLAITLALFHFCAGAAISNELLSVIVVYRHGDRAPLVVYPNDPHNASIWKDGLGQLSNAGKHRHYELGKWLRNRYDGFLSQTYSSDEFFVCSTDVDRTFMSAASNLAGLYPPQGEQIWNADINWQPIPIHTANPAYITSTLCPKAHELMAELLKTDEFVEYNKQNAELYVYLSENSDSNVFDIESATLIWDTLFVETHNNMLLPDWTLDVYPEKLQPIADMYYATFGYTEEIRRMTAGAFLQNVIKHFQKFSSNSSEAGLQKFLMYSAHDINVASILAGLGVFKPHCPYFASTIIFELRKKNDEYVVNMYYKNEEDAEPIVLKGCTGNCKLADFEENLNNITITPDQWTKDCNFPDTSSTY